MPRPFPVYVVDDDVGLRDFIVMVGEDAGLAVRGFESGDDLLSALDELQPGCILLDMRMPRKNGLEVQADLNARGNKMPVITITGFGDVDMAVQSMKLGALEFLEKPFANQVLIDAIGLAFDQLEERELAGN
ncbi:MAG TPA: response regulator [Allosphingosinicella sp.]|uniref:response regulator transcription factor n=1 Tax=Allosphingosinicella sp. TaxID=2823234 RepID=UPI002ED87942